MIDSPASGRGNPFRRVKSKNTMKILNSHVFSDRPLSNFFNYHIGVFVYLDLHPSFIINDIITSFLFLHACVHLLYHPTPCCLMPGYPIVYKVIPPPQPFTRRCVSRRMNPSLLSSGYFLYQAPSNLPSLIYNHQTTPTKTPNNPMPIPNISLPPLAALGTVFLFPAEDFEVALALALAALPECMATAVADAL